MSQTIAEKIAVIKDNTDKLAKMASGSAEYVKLANSIVDRSIVEFNGQVESIRDYAFANCKALTSVDLPSTTSIGIYAFSNCYKLISINLPSATKIDSNAFGSCTSLTSVDLPSTTSIGSYAFSNCTYLTSVDLPSATKIGDSTFGNCTVLTTLIIRNTEEMCTMSASSAFNNTPIKSGTGYIYVPKALVDSYKTATNWSVYANQIRAIEDYPDICGGAE